MDGVETNVFEKIDNLKELLRSGTGKALRDVVLSVERDAKKILTIKVYTGDRPYKRTGRLRRSVTHDFGRVGDRFTGRVGSNVVYASYIEFGSAKRRFAGKPYLRPALQMNKEKAETIFRSQIKDIEKKTEGKG